MTEILPKAITADRNQGILKITWVDGHASDYPFELLRAACPCASCRGGHENMHPEPDEEVFLTHLPDGPEIECFPLKVLALMPSRSNGKTAIIMGSITGITYESCVPVRNAERRKNKTSAAFQKAADDYYRS